MPLSLVKTTIVSSSPSGCLQRLRIAPTVAIEALDLEVVVQDVAADLGRVGQERRDGDVLGLIPTSPRSLLVGPVRIGGLPNQKQNGWSFGPAQELLEAAERRSGRVAGPAACLTLPGPQPLPRQADVVAGGSSRSG